VRAIVVAALVMVAAALTAPAASQAATPCWQRVLDDWRDGRIDGEYSVRCYRDALAHLPEDLRVYGTAEVDIQRALTRELAERATEGRRDTQIVATKPDTSKRAKVAARSHRRTLAMHAPKKPTVRRAAAPTGDVGTSSFPMKLVLVLGIAALVAAVALASWRRAVAVGRRRQEP
jgi:hypothetical protein